jgi:hypothetical protein
MGVVLFRGTVGYWPHFTRAVDERGMKKEWA